MLLLLLFNAKSIKGFVCMCVCVQTVCGRKDKHNWWCWGPTIQLGVGPEVDFLFSSAPSYPILPEQAPAQLSAVDLCATCLKKRLIRRAARRSQFERALDVTTSSSGSLSQFDRHTDVCCVPTCQRDTMYEYTIHYATTIVIRISIESSWFHSYIWCVLFELAAPFDELLAGCFALVLAPGHWCRLSVQFPLWEKRKIIIIRDD